MRIAFISPEVSPYSKTGGLADVSGTLPAALARLGHDVTVITPLYASVDRERHGLAIFAGRGEMPGLGGTEIWTGPGGPVGVRHFFIRTAAFERVGLYQENGRDFPDNDERFAFFSRASLALLKHLSFRPDVIHLNDWQTALVSVYLKIHHLEDEFFSGTGTVLSIHNMAYQGIFERVRWRVLNLPDNLFRPDALEFYGKINFLKGGMVFSDMLSTVSPRYAREIQTTSGGCGMDGLLKSRRDTLVGVLNGIDYAEWNPSGGDGVFPPYSADRPENKEEAKKILSQKFGLSPGGSERASEGRPASAGVGVAGTWGTGGADPEMPALGAAGRLSHPAAPILGSVTRLDAQKGCDILLRALFRILPKSDARFVLLGTGDRHLEVAFSNMAKQFPGRVGLALKFDPALAKLIYAGSDFFLMPSKYEPCGLGQMIAMAYGTIPIVRLTGGLADTVKIFNEQTRAGNGFGFESYTSESLIGAIQKSFQIYGNPDMFRALQLNAMRERFTWERAARSYLDLYARSIHIRQKGGDGTMAVKMAEKSERTGSLIYEIGESAGKVYQYLSRKAEGESLAQIAKGADLESGVCDMAVGWLARENNVAIERQGKKFLVRLIQR